MTVRRVFLRNIVLAGEIGVLPHEHGRRQRVRINVELEVDEQGGPRQDDLTEVVDYAKLAERVRATVAAGHHKLVETLAERIASSAFFDGRVRSVRVRVEKLDVFDDIEAVGVEIERVRPDLSTRAD